MKDIYIIGSGGFAKEVHFLIRNIGGFRIKAFVDKESSDPLYVGGTLTPVIGDIELEKHKGSNIAFGIGDPKLLLKLSEKLKGNFIFPNLIQSNVVADWQGIKIGEGNIICSGVNLTTEITIGSFNIFNLCCTVGHDTIIGDCNVFNPGCNISGGVSIQDCVLIGTNSTVLQYKNIGSNAIIGAASLVTKNVECDSIVIGVPAKPISK